MQVYLFMCDAWFRWPVLSSEHNLARNMLHSFRPQSHLKTEAMFFGVLLPLPLARSGRVCCISPLMQLKPPTPPALTASGSRARVRSRSPRLSSFYCAAFSQARHVVPALDRLPCGPKLELTQQPLASRQGLLSAHLVSHCPPLATLATMSHRG